MPILWEPIKGETIEEGRVRPYGATIYRAHVPGGWLVRDEGSTCFIPDPTHEWENVKSDDASRGVRSTVTMNY